MEARFSLFCAAPQAYKAMLGLEQHLHGCGLQEPLLHLIKLRASQPPAARDLYTVERHEVVHEPRELSSHFR